MQQHDAAYQVEAKEHRQRQRHIVRHDFPTDRLVFVRQFRRPLEVVLAGYRVYGTYRHFQYDLTYSLPRHRYPPVVRAIVDHEQLQCETMRLMGWWAKAALYCDSSDLQVNAHVPELRAHDRLRSIRGASQSRQKLAFLKLLNRTMPAMREDASQLISLQSIHEFSRGYNESKWELIVPRDCSDTTSFFMDLIKTRKSIRLYCYTNVDGMEIEATKTNEYQRAGTALHGRNLFGQYQPN